MTYHGQNHDIVIPPHVVGEAEATVNPHGDENAS